MISEKSGLGGIDLFDGQPRPPRDPGDEVISPRTVALKRRYGSVFHAPRTSDVQFSPSLLEDLRRLLRENHLLLLVGSEITQHERYQFAFVLAQYLNQHHKDSRKILCWRPWVNLDDFPAYLADFPKKDAETGKWAPGIFIFPEVEAHHFQYSLAAMIDIARIRHHTVILTTTIPQNEWLTLWEKLSSPETEDSDLSTLPHPQVFGKHLFNLRRDEIYRDEDAAFQFLYESAAEDDFRSSGNREPISAKRYQEKAYLGINLLHRLYRSKTALLGKQKLEFDESYTLQLDIENDLREMLSFPIARERTVLQVARRLRNLGDVDRFVDLMTANHRVQVSSSSGEPRPTLGLPPVGEEEASSYFATEDVDRILRAFPEKDLQENALNGKAVQESVQIWYGKLDERQRHLLLGLCLLNGLYDKQFFMALEELVENDWRAAESIPGDFDYRDFGPLQEYLFVGVDNGENETILKIAPRLWRRIFRECWRENQRLMVKSVSSLLNLVKNAILVETGITFTFTQNTLERLSELGVSESFLAPLSQFLGRTFSRQAEFFREVSRLLGSLYLEHHKEAFKIAFDSQLLFSREDFREIETIEHQTQLYGHKGKNVLLRAVVSNTLAELGSEDPGYIRETLLRLAMDKEESLRDFSAEALGKWRNWPAGSSVRAQQDEAFIQIVQRWQKNPEQEFDPQGSGLPADQKAHIKNCKEIIRATVLSAVGQAAIYDLPNTCDARLMAQLVQLTKQAFPEMRKKLGAVSLPLFMKYHPRQLLAEGDFVGRAVRNTAASEMLAHELALYYHKDPDLLEAFLDYLRALRVRRLNGLTQFHRTREMQEWQVIFKSRKSTSKFLTKGMDAIFVATPGRLQSILIAVYGNLYFKLPAPEYSAADIARYRQAIQEAFSALSEIYQDKPIHFWDRYRRRFWEKPESEALTESLRKAVGIAGREQFRRDFYTVEHYAHLLLKEMEPQHLVLTLDGLIETYLLERKAQEKRRVVGIKKAYEDHPYGDFEEKPFDLERQPVELEKTLVKSWFTHRTRRVSQGGFLALFGLRLMEGEKYAKPDEKPDFEYTYFPELWQKIHGAQPHSWGIWRLVCLFFFPLYFFVPGFYRGLVANLRLLIALDRVYPQETAQQLKLWFKKSEDPDIRLMGLVLRKGLTFSKWVLPVTGFLGVLLLWVLLNFLMT